MSNGNGSKKRKTDYNNNYYGKPDSNTYMDMVVEGKNLFSQYIIVATDKLTKDTGAPVSYAAPVGIDYPDNAWHNIKVHFPQCSGMAAFQKAQREANVGYIPEINDNMKLNHPVIKNIEVQLLAKTIPGMDADLTTDQFAADDAVAANQQKLKYYEIKNTNQYHTTWFANDRDEITNDIKLTTDPTGEMTGKLRSVNPADLTTGACALAVALQNDPLVIYHREMVKSYTCRMKQGSPTATTVVPDTEMMDLSVKPVNIDEEVSVFNFIPDGGKILLETDLNLWLRSSILNKKVNSDSAHTPQYPFPPSKTNAKNNLSLYEQPHCAYGIKITYSVGQVKISDMMKRAQMKKLFPDLIPDQFKAKVDRMSNVVGDPKYFDIYTSQGYVRQDQVMIPV